jgi:geranylgeranyl diphosphate synthase type 3
VDDIEDDSQLRRGNPGNSHASLSERFDHSDHLVTHKIYGVPQTINTANYVYFLAYQELFALRSSSSTLRQPLDEIVTSLYL